MTVEGFIAGLGGLVAGFAAGYLCRAWLSRRRRERFRRSVAYYTSGWYGTGEAASAPPAQDDTCEAAAAAEAVPAEAVAEEGAPEVPAEPDRPAAEDKEPGEGRPPPA